MSQARTLSLIGSAFAVNTTNFNVTVSNSIIVTANTNTNNIVVTSNTTTANLTVTSNTTTNNISVTSNAFFANVTIANNITITAGQLVFGNSYHTNTQFWVGNSTVNSSVSATSVTVSNSTSVTTIGPGSINSSNTSLTGSTSILSIFESAIVNATPITGAQNIDVLTGPTYYYISTSAGNFTVNVRGNSSKTLDSILANNQSVTVTLLVTQGWPFAYYPTAFSIDGTSVSPKWIGGVAPSSGDLYATNMYSYTIIKTGIATYTVLATATKYA